MIFFFCKSMERCRAANVVDPQPSLRCELSGVVWAWWVGGWFGLPPWFLVDNGGPLLLYGRPHGMMADNAATMPAKFLPKFPQSEGGAKTHPQE